METYLLSAFAPNNLSGWIAALFTFAAVVAALYVAGAAALREKKQAKSAATLIAARISPILDRDALTMARAAATIEFLVGERLPPQRERVAAVAVALRQLAFTPDDATLLALVPLERGCAHKISRAYGIVSLLNTEISSKVWSLETADSDSITRLETSFLEVSELLRDAAETCRKSGQVVALELPKTIRDGIHA